MRARALIAICLGASALAGACADASPDDGDASPPDPLSGGATTAFDATKSAYSNAASNLRDEDYEAFNFGHSLFDHNWVTAPATTDDIDGLGPLFNARSCSGCHAHDGRAPVFDPQGNFLGLLFRLSVPGADAHGGPLGDPVYGTQLRPDAILGVPTEGVAHVVYTEEPGTYGDGSVYSLQRPTYSFDGWGYGEPSSDLLVSPRVPPFTIGLGLLEAIAEADLVANERGGTDGVFGRPNHVFEIATGATTIGRFGWKANVPSVLQQTAGAFDGDMGITSSLDPDDACTAGMSACLAAPNGGAPEITDDRLAAVVFYMRTLAVPARRAVDDPIVQSGEAEFASFGCGLCHVRTFVTGELEGVPEVGHQTIHPYTDLLLHDMGEGLADGRPDGEASGSEWRTPPLWGIGLLEKVNGHQSLLHDGRARGFAEAILWHGGEAEHAKERFRTATVAAREALVTFLESL